jgi:hypothetical protein
VTIVTVFLLAACRREPPAEAAAPSAAPSVSAVASVSASSSEAPRAQSCEVEITGKVTPFKPDTFVYVSEGDCLDEDPKKVLGRAVVLDTGKFFIEVFTGWGADITICAAVGEASTLYGKAPRTYHAEANGEIYVNDVAIALAKGAPKTFGLPALQ